MSNLALDNIRKKVVYQNTVDIWIAMCQEQDTDWNNTETYRKFIAYLLKTSLTMKKFPLCIRNPVEILNEDMIRQNLVRNFQNQTMKIVQFTPLN